MNFVSAMKQYSIAILIYGDVSSGRNALVEDKYKELADAFIQHKYAVKSVLYNDEISRKVYKELLLYDVVLVWVNPIEHGGNRKILDAILAELSGKGCIVSAHPEVILKMGTKDILYKTKDMDWGSDIRIYTSYDDFVNLFPASIQKSGIRVLKQYRGNGGHGVFKIIKSPSENEFTVVQAQGSNEPTKFSSNDFYSEFRPYFQHNGLLIDQEWSVYHSNGMVRCYLTGNKVSGFGYQEVNALYELNINNAVIHLPPGKRYYFTENCGLFSDLKQLMENSWVPELQQILSINNEMLPLIWDADFFITNTTGNSTGGRYKLCEINVSCVSPFPPSSIKYIVAGVSKRITEKNNSA